MLLMTTPIFKDPGGRVSNKKLGTQLGHRLIIMQKELPFHQLNFLRICVHNIT